MAGGEPPGAIHQIVDGVGGLVGIDVLEWNLRGYLHGLFMEPNDKGDNQSRQDGRREQGYAGGGARADLNYFLSGDTAMQFGREAVRQARAQIGKLVSLARLGALEPPLAEVLEAVQHVGRHPVGGAARLVPDRG